MGLFSWSTPCFCGHRVAKKLQFPLICSKDILIAVSCFRTCCPPESPEVFLQRLFWPLWFPFVLPALQLVHLPLAATSREVELLRDCSQRNSRLLRDGLTELQHFCRHFPSHLPRQLRPWLSLLHILTVSPSCTATTRHLITLWSP